MQNDHYQMSEYEGKQRPHDEEVPEPGPVESSHQPRQPGKLYRLPDGEAGNYRQGPEPDRGGVSVLLQWVVGFVLGRLGTKEKVMSHHRPYPGKIAVGKQ